MRLKKLELSGFKSFARKTALEFPSAVTAVVGPNGSGKSNIAESLRWALGEQSMKSLRGKRGEDLIFNGTPSVSRAGRASVSLCLDNGGKKLPIAYDEVVITRTISRDGESEYLINDSTVRLKDVTELLGNVGLGVSSHHIISQGEADRFLSASSKERKAMIEEALGLKIYQAKKEDAEKRLAKTGENINQVNSIRAEAQRQLKFLKKQVERAEEAVLLKEELKKLYAEYFKNEDAYLAAETEKIKIKKREITEKLSRFDSVNAPEAESDEAAALKKETDRLEREVADMEKITAELGAKRNLLERELGKLEGIIEYKEKENVGHNAGKKIVVSGEEILPVLERIAGEAKAAAMAADMVLAKKYLLNIVDITGNFIGKISKIKTGGGGNEVELASLKNKKTELALAVNEIAEAEKNSVAESSKKREEIKSLRNRLAETERLLLQSRAEARELKFALAQLDSEGEKIRLRRDESGREKKEAAAITGNDFADIVYDGLNTSGWNYEKREAALRQIERLKIKLEDYGVGAGEIIKEYEEARRRDEEYEKNLSDLAEAAKSLERLMEELDKKISSDFENGLKKINTEFNNFFLSIFGGGKAGLELVRKEIRGKNSLEDEDEENEAAEYEMEAGIEISVNHPKKRISSLEMLSGGERSLVAISLLFALSQVNPPPFLVLDETDAALDESNSRKYADMLKKLGEKTQLIVITHNRETMRQADILYGVTMGADGVSRLLSVKFDDAKEYSEA